MLFLKEHLVNNHYTWPENEPAVLRTGDPRRTLFDRFNGNQVLNIINFFGTSIGKLTVAIGQKVEELIANQLPADTKSEVTVFNWLRGEYLYYAE